MFWLAMVTLHLTPYYRGIRYHTNTLPKYDAAVTDLDECRGATVDGEYAYYLTKKGGQACLKGTKGTVTNAAAADPKAVCPKQGKEVTFGADVVEGHSCPIQVALTGYLIDVASFDSDVDPETHDLKAACPDPTACAWARRARHRRRDGLGQARNRRPHGQVKGAPVEPHSMRAA